MALTLDQGTTLVVPQKRKKESSLRVCTLTPEFGKPEGRTADPSTTLRSGRDDNFVWEC